MRRRRLEANDRLGLRSRPDPADEDLELRQAARVAGGAALLEQPHSGELRIRREARRNDRLVRLELRRGWRACPWWWRHRQIALELSGRDQMIHEPTTDPEALGDRRLFQTLL